MLDPLHRPADRIGSDLQPEIADRSAIASEDARHGEATFSEDLDMMTEAEDHALERRAPDMRQAVMQPQPDDGAACIGIMQRRLLGLGLHHRLAHIWRAA